MSVQDLGELQITDCDDSNIPVNCRLRQFEGMWDWSADNFMPLKSAVDEGMYNLVSESKEEILNLIHKHVVPLYTAALANIQIGTLFYWREPE